MSEYERIWKKYAYPENGSRFYRLDELKEHLLPEQLDGRIQSCCGVPLIKEDNTVHVNNRDEHMIIFGGSGAKKTRCVIIPLMISVASAMQSMIITDVKGEISGNPKIRGLLEEKGYRTVFMDFRSCLSDGYNVFQAVCEKYAEGDVNNAMRILNSMISSLVDKYANANNDKFWGSMSSQHLMGIITFLLELCTHNKGYAKYMNMSTAGSFVDEDATDRLSSLIEQRYSGVDNNYIQLLRNVFSAPEKTKSSIVATSAASLRDFMLQKDLLDMLSISTFRIEDLYEKPTAVFMIIPDETSAYEMLSGFIMDCFYEQLVSCHNRKYMERKAPRNIHWICDEFCNLHINDMKSKISASRSRQMRWYLVAQSKRQLEGVYASDASVILGNCKSTLFLQSPDMEMLKYISELCGTSYSEEGREPLVTPEMLQKLKKTWAYKEGIYINDHLRSKVILYDYDRYECLDRFAGCDTTLPIRIQQKTETYTPYRLIQDAYYKRIALPWLKEER